MTTAHNLHTPRAARTPAVFPLAHAGPAVGVPQERDRGAAARFGLRSRRVAPGACALLLALTAGLAFGQPTAPSSPAPSAPPAPPAPPIGLEAYENRLTRAVEITGLKSTDEQLVRNAIRSAPGQPLSQTRVQEDIRTLTRLGRFKEVAATVQPYDDGTVALRFVLVEAPIIKDVQVTGNFQVTDPELRNVVSLLANTPVDRFQLDRTVRAIENLYRRKGYYQVTVTVDEKELTENGNVLFVIREGERLAVTDITFEGNVIFAARQLRPSIKTEESGIFQSGTLDDNLLDQDVAAIIKFYKDRGYLDARVDRRIQPAPNGRECAVNFLIEEGPLYTLRSVRIDLVQAGDEKRPARPGDGLGTVIISREQAAGLMPIRSGDVYSIDRINKAVENLKAAYGQMGYIDASVTRSDLRDPAQPVVDLYLQVFEGSPAKTGLIIIKGDELTKQTVIRRQVKVQPDRPLDATAVRETEQRLANIDLFAGPREGRPEPRLTVQPTDPTNPGYNDVLIEVEEKNTGSLSFGVAAGSDGGVVGAITLTQRNFDLYDVPDSFSEFFTGRAFRGAGQRFEIAVQPGSQVSNYSISLTDPSLLDSEYGLGGSVYYRQREFNEYDDDRLGTSLNLSRRFGQIWSGSLGLRIENVDISNIDLDSIVDVFAVEGESSISGLAARLVRNTADNRFLPGKGTRLELGVERVGLLGGDYDFTKLGAEYQIFLTVGEDYLGRKTILTFKTSANYIPEGENEVPIFERYFLGGRSFRGFNFRGVSPRGLQFDRTTPDPTDTIASNDPAGGTFAFFFGPELEQPIFQNVVSTVIFIDSGTVTNNVGFEDYRVSAGMGLRLRFPALGPAPLAFDFGFPV
ncbi:MAG: outer membrane protein assembly factor BamA, partial [Phycisphaerales bacterium]